MALAADVGRSRGLSFGASGSGGSTPAPEQPGYASNITPRLTSIDLDHARSENNGTSTTDANGSKEHVKLFQGADGSATDFSERLIVVPDSPVALHIPPGPTDPPAYAESLASSSSQAGSKKGDPPGKVPPPPVLPDELLAVLSLDPSDREEMKKHIPRLDPNPTTSEDTQIPTLTTSSPVAAHTLLTSSNHIEEDGSMLDYANETIQHHFSTTSLLAPNNTAPSSKALASPTTPRAHTSSMVTKEASHIYDPPSGQSARFDSAQNEASASGTIKTDKADLYRKQANEGLGIGMLDGVTGRAEYARKQERTVSGPLSNSNTAGDNDIKRMWKSFSSKLARNSKDKSQSSTSTGGSALAPSTSRRTSITSDQSQLSNASRRSLSIYNYRSPHLSNTPSASPYSTQSEFRPNVASSPSSNTALVPPLFTRRSSNSVVLSGSISLSAGTSSNYSSDRFDRSSLSTTTGLASYAEEDDLAWPATETFVTDLSQHKRRKSKASTPSLLDITRQRVLSGSAALGIEDEQREMENQDLDGMDGEFERMSDMELEFNDEEDGAEELAEPESPISSLHTASGFHFPLEAASHRTRTGAPPESSTSSPRASLVDIQKPLLAHSVGPQQDCSSHSSIQGLEPDPQLVPLLSHSACTGTAHNQDQVDEISVSKFHSTTSVSSSNHPMRPTNPPFPVSTNSLANESLQSKRTRRFSEGFARLSIEPESVSKSPGLGLEDELARADSPSREGAGAVDGTSGLSSLGSHKESYVSHSYSDPQDVALTRHSKTERLSAADFVVAVVGPKQVGKSTIIECNLRLSKTTANTLYEDENSNRVVSYIGQFSVIGKLRTIEILKVDMDILRNSAEGLIWPASLPKLDSALICYRQGDPKALETLGTLLKGFWIRGGIALIALATQCKPANAGEVKPERDEAAKICNMYGAGLVHLDGGLEDPNRKAKNSLQWVLKKVIDARDLSARSSPMSKRRNKDAMEISLANKKSTATLLATESMPQSSEALRVSDSPPTVASASPLSNTIQEQEATPHTVTFSAESTNDTTSSKFSQLDIYLSKEDLIQKFLYAAITGNDDQHVTSFLIVYRRFARPYDVLKALIERFNFCIVHSETDFLLSRYMQMKLCKVLTQWLEQHPGDFCAPPTFRSLKNFLNDIFALNWVQHYAMEIANLCQHVERTVDQDAAWALPDQQYSDPQSTVPDSAIIERRPSLVPSLSSDYTGSNASTSTSALKSSSSSFPATPGLPPASPSVINNKQNSSPFGRGRSYSDTETNASSDAAQSITSNQSLVTRLTSRKHFHLIQTSNAILESSADRIAEQITKIAWDIFSRIQPRELLRYVMVPRDPDNPGAKPTRNPDDPVHRSIVFGNYLADWVATMVLAQNRQKNRVRLVEQFIRVAIGLRELDNFDCLMGILAGLGSQPVHRLNEMAESVDKDVYKKFRSLQRLMGSSRSFAAYRMAITNARPEMIPYLGVHLQDITRLHDGKSDMRNGLVNWSKMRQIGGHCAIVADCSRLAPHYANNEQIARIVANVPVYSLDTDEILYDLSYLYKPRGAQTSSQPSKLRRLIRDTLNPTSI